MSHMPGISVVCELRPTRTLDPWKCHGSRTCQVTFTAEMPEIWRCVVHVIHGYPHVKSNLQHTHTLSHSRTHWQRCVDCAWCSWCRWYSRCSRCSWCSWWKHCHILGLQSYEMPRGCAKFHSNPMQSLHTSPALSWWISNPLQWWLLILSLSLSLSQGHKETKESAGNHAVFAVDVPLIFEERNFTG